MSTLTLILGAPDPEMQAIETIGRDVGATVIYAYDAHGERVRPETAYRTDALSAPVPPDATVYAVECDGPAIPPDAVRIDHHRPGDPGYGRPPAEFLAASSIGQVWRILRKCAHPRMGFFAYDREWILSDGGETRDVGGCLIGPPYAEAVPLEIVLAAAADHCLAAAYRGECLGVDPDALMRWRVECRAAFQRRSPAEILADIEAAREILREAPLVRLATEPWEPACGVHGRSGACWQSGAGDPTARTDECYALGDPLAVADLRGRSIPELPEAAAREGICFVADGLPGPDGRVKVVCQSGSPEQIEAFMRVWGPAQGLTDIYGDPARGFAGGYH